MPVIQMLNGLSIRTYEPPPTGFDPLTAPDSLLLHHGFPARPDPQTAPELRKLWERAVSGKTYVVPTFGETPGKTHGPGHMSGTAVPGTSPSWSGSVVSVPNAGNSFQWILSRWTIPNLDPTGTTDQFTSQWIGIDGVLRVGTETDLQFRAGGGLVGGPTQPVYYAWWEWDSPDAQREHYITNFLVAPGDVMWGALCVNSPTSVTIYLSTVNGTAGTSFTVTQPSGTTLVGNSAEWIVGRPVVDGVLYSLPNYGVVYFDEARANFVTGTPGSKQNPTEIDLGAGTLVTMVGNNNNPLSVPTIETQQLMEVNWRGAF